MTINFFEIRPTKTGTFRTFVIGQPVNHSTNRRGGNYREMVVPGVGGQASVAEAVAALRAVYATERDLQAVIVFNDGSRARTVAGSRTIYKLAVWPRMQATQICTASV